ncbi:hypothetical protein BDZ97DRAFT_1759207 [Flammula alnicola]|nr:hypothetical protein BDZ97DRAFT_1759207 [Flammula alnicola]
MSLNSERDRSLRRSLWQDESVQTHEGIRKTRLICRVIAVGQQVLSFQVPGLFNTSTDVSVLVFLTLKTPDMERASTCQLEFQVPSPTVMPRVANFEPPNSSDGEALTLDCQQDRSSTTLTPLHFSRKDENEVANALNDYQVAEDEDPSCPRSKNLNSSDVRLKGTVYGGFGSTFGSSGEDHGDTVKPETLLLRCGRGMVYRSKVVLLLRLAIFSIGF